MIKVADVNLHVVLEIIMFVVLLLVWFKKSSKAQVATHDVLSESEMEQIIDEWEPEPFVSPEALTELQKDSDGGVVIDRCDGSLVVVGGKELRNFASINPIGMLNNKEVEAKCEKALRKYGCGSCGPRGFYGSIDVHLHLERRMAEFMGTEQAILYSYGFATVASAVPTFAKSFDTIFCDEGVSHAVQVGCQLARSRIVYFRHNDAEHLDELLQKHRPRMNKEKRFIVIEGLYVNYGDVAPLKRLVEVKERHCCYLIADESYSIGVLGRTGRGLTEACGVPVSCVDVLIGNLGNALGSIGGFCAGSKTVVGHQRINSAGYVFSASLPPFLSVAAHAAFDRIDSEPRLLEDLSKRSEALLSAIGKCALLETTSHTGSPIVHVREPSASVASLTRDECEERLERVVRDMKGRGYLLTRAKYVPGEKFRPPPSLRISIPGDVDVSCVANFAVALTASAKKILA